MRYVQVPVPVVERLDEQLLGHQQRPEQFAAEGHRRGGAAQVQPATVPIGDSMAVPPWHGIPAAVATAAIRWVTVKPPDLVTFSEKMSAALALTMRSASCSLRRLSSAMIGISRSWASRAAPSCPRPAAAAR